MIKRSIRLLFIFMITVSLSAICACNKKHEHTYKEGWANDETYHWRIATCGDIEIGFKGLHNFVDGVCTLCNYKDPNYVPPKKPDTDDPDIDEPGTEDPGKDPGLPDDDPGSTERPSAPDDSTDPSDSDDPTDPDDDPFNDPILDANDDTLYSPKNDYVWGNRSIDGDLKFTEMLKDGKPVGYAVSASGKITKREISIPAKYKNLPVLMVDDDGFYMCDFLQKIILPQGMEFIGERAFYECSDLYHVTVPSSVRLIGARAFYGDAYLTQITLPEGVEDIRYGAFKGCAFDKFVIPNSVTSISSLAFYNCMCMNELTFGSGVQSVGAQAFCESDKLKKVNISDLKAWCNVSFAYDNSNPLYYGAALYLNGRLLEDVVIPEGCQVKQNSFVGCSSIKKLTITDGTTEVGSFAFYSCEKLAEVVFSDTVQVIKSEAFGSCSSLSKVVFGTGISKIERDAFTALPKSAQFFYRGTAEMWNEISKSNWLSGADGDNIVFDYSDQ